MAGLVQIVLQDGGIDGQTTREFSESTVESIAQRIADQTGGLVLGTSRILFKNRCAFGCVVREVATFQLAVRWGPMSAEHANANPTHIFIPDDGQSLYQWALAAAKAMVKFEQIGMVVGDMQRLLQDRLRHEELKQIAQQHGTEALFSAPVTPIPPPGMSAAQLMLQMGRLDPLWLEQVAPTPPTRSY